jgi:hypothetical protein
MARPRLDRTKKVVSARLSPELHNSIVLYQSEHDVNFTTALEQVCSMGILYYYYTKDKDQEMENTC